MPKTKITCPECDAALNIDDSLPVGKKIKCPTCQAIFALPVGNADAVSAKRLPPPPRDADDDTEWDDDLRPARRRGSRREKQGMGAGAVVALIAVSLLVAGGVGAGTYFLVTLLIPAPVAEVDVAPVQQQ